jgi:dephospho-CoA kinase
VLLVGLTGGLATGKSFVGQELQKLGGHLIQADELGHQVLLPGGEAYEAAVAEFGKEILTESGEIDRRKLGELVFAQPERLARLNAIVHPAVRKKEREIAAEIAAREPDAIVVVEAAILVETGSYGRFDKLIVVACGREQQIERAMKRSGLSRAEAESRLQRQLSDEEKVKFADFVIDTSQSKAHTAEQARAVYKALRSVSR